jgi:hypothetical protein
MRIRLHPSQIEALRPFYDRVQAAAQLGRSGMLVAQVRWDNQEGKWWLEPGFLAHEYAQLITEKGEP